MMRVKIRPLYIPLRPNKASKGKEYTFKPEFGIKMPWIEMINSSYW